MLLKVILVIKITIGTKESTKLVHKLVNLALYNEKEKNIDHAIAICAIHLAIHRHAGIYAKGDDAVMGVMAGTAIGRDLRHIKNIVCAGGILVNATDEEKAKIIEGAFDNPGNSLLPIDHPRVVFDEHYLMFSLGVLSKWFPDEVLDFMLEHWDIQ